MIEFDKLDKALYDAPKLIEYGSIREITTAASGCPRYADAMYYLGYINNLNSCDDAFS